MNIRPYTRDCKHRRNRGTDWAECSEKCYNKLLCQMLSGSHERYCLTRANKVGVASE